MSACVAASAMADAPARVWSEQVSGVFKDNAPAYNARFAANLDYVYASGAYNQDATIAGVPMTAAGTGAYIVQYSNSGAANWAVSLNGSITVKDLETDANGILYVAAVFTDIVTLGSTDGNSVDIDGVIDTDTPYSDQAASVLIKYDASGKLLAHTEFLPHLLPEIKNNYDNTSEMGPWYYGEPKFIINDIQFRRGRLYASALYTGITTNGEATFEANSNCAWGMMYDDLSAASVFSVSTALVDCQSIVTCSTGENLNDADPQYAAYGAAMTPDFMGNVYATFVAQGQCVVATSDTDKKKIDIDATSVNYVMVSVKSGAIENTNVYTIPGGEASQTNVAYAMTINGDNVEFIGNTVMNTSADPDNSVFERVVIFATAPASTLEASYTYSKLIEDKIAYNRLTSAAFLDGRWKFAARGVYNENIYEDADGDGEPDKDPVHRQGDFTDSFRCGSFIGDTYTAAPVADAVAISGAGKDKEAFATVSGTGAEFSVYTVPSGIEDVTISDENAPVEYYNLQGVRVENPSNGLYIRRQGSTATKVVM